MALPNKEPTPNPAPAPAAAAPQRAPLTAVPQSPQARRLKKGELLFKEGDNSRAMYLLKSGMIRIFKKKGESFIEIDTVRSGQIIGELAFLDGNPRSASGEALVDCELIEISGPAFQAVLTQMPDWLKILFKTVVGRLRTASTRIRQLETASTAVDYSDKSGKRSSSYVYLSHLDVLKILSGILLIASRHGKSLPDGRGIDLRLSLTSRYINQIMGVPESKITTMTDVLIQAGLITMEADAGDLANSRTILTDIQFLEQLIAYLNDENLTEPNKRHDITPRGFYIMSLIYKHLKKFAKDEKSGFTPVNLHEVRKLETSAEGKEPFRIDEFQLLVNLGYATNVDLKSSTEAITLVNADLFSQAFRFQKVCMFILAANEQKRK